MELAIFTEGFGMNQFEHVTNRYLRMNHVISFFTPFYGIMSLGPGISGIEFAGSCRHLGFSINSLRCLGTIAKCFCVSITDN